MLTHFIESYHQFMGRLADQPLASAVFLVLMVQLILISLLIAHVSFRRLKRLISRIRNQEREDHLRKMIIDYYFQHFDSDGANRNQNVGLPKIGWENRGFFRRVLISTASRFSGRDRGIFIQLYREMGYLEQDLKDLRSWCWWRRLAAVTRIENIQAHEAVSIILDLIADPNEMVALSAMRAASALHFPGKASKILDSLSRRAPTRRDIFVDILNNLGHEHADEIVDYLLNCYDPYIASICISVLGSLRVQRASDILMGFLKSANDEVVAEAIRSLSLLKQKEALPYIRSSLNHPHPRVREASVEALARFVDTGSVGGLLKLEDDPDVRVRRAVFFALHGGF